jgi:hypothetical protein
MKKMKTALAAIGVVIAATTLTPAYATGCTGAEACDLNIASATENTTYNGTTNVVTTEFSEASQHAALRLKSVYDTTATFSQNNSGLVQAVGLHDALVTTGYGNAQVEVTAIANNFSANLVGLESVNLSVSQKNTGNVNAENMTHHPYVGGNLEVSTTAIGNNASLGWDLTTDKTPSDNNFGVKRDGPLRSFDTVGSLIGSVEQCNTGDIVARTNYMQDPAANIKVSTTAIGNNLSFGVKTR